MLHESSTQTHLICVPQYRAMRKAMREAHLSAATLDLDLLIVLTQSTEPLAFGHIYKRHNTAQPSTSNFTYYAALDRLQQKGFVIVSYGTKNWRMWSATPAGHDFIAQLDQLAQKYLPG